MHICIRTLLIEWPSICKIKHIKYTIWKMAQTFIVIKLEYFQCMKWMWFQQSNSFIILTKESMSECVFVKLYHGEFSYCIHNLFFWFHVSIFLFSLRYFQIGRFPAEPILLSFCTRRCVSIQTSITVTRPVTRIPFQVLLHVLPEISNSGVAYQNVCNECYCTGNGPGVAVW